MSPFVPGQIPSADDWNQLFASFYPATGVSAYSGTLLAAQDNTTWLTRLGVPDLSALGQPNGIATLDATAKLLPSQVPELMPGNFSVKGPLPWVDVVAYGAVGDGATDNTAAIGAAIAGLPAAGGSLYFPPGVYNVAGTIALNRGNLSLWGAGPGVAIIQTTSATNDLIALGDGLSTYTGLSIFGLSLTALIARTAGNAINAQGLAQLFLRELVIESPFNGIALANCPYTLISGVIVHNPAAGAAGIAINGGGNYFLDRALVYTDSTQCANGLQVAACDSLWVANSHFVATGYGLAVTPGSGQTAQKIFLINTSASGCANDGLSLAPGSGGSIIGCRFDGRMVQNSGNGINIGSSGTVKGVQIVNSHVYDNALAGINIGGGSHVMVDGCYVGSNSTSSSGTLSGIKIAAAVSSFNIRGNHIGLSPTGAASQKYGIEVAAGASNNYAIIGNDLNNNVTAGLSDGGTGTNKQVLANFPATADTKAVLGGTLRLSSYGAGTLVTDASGNVTAGSPTLPGIANNLTNSITGSSSASAKMMGLNKTITPRVNGRVMFVICGSIVNAAGSGTQANVQIRYGTGAVPSNGDAATGTAIGANQELETASGGYRATFALCGVAAGLSLNVAYWIDVALTSDGSHVINPEKVSIAAVEV